MSRLLAWVFCVACSIVGDRVAMAQTEDPRAVEARKACASGDVDKGIKLLAEILATTDDPTAVYNMGRCYQQNGQAEKAILQFREYLRKARDLNAEERRMVEAHLREAEADDRAKRAAASVPQPNSGLTPLPDPTVGTTVPTDRSTGNKKLRLAGIGVGSLGVVSLGTGLFFGLQAHSLQRQHEKQDNMFSLADDKAGHRAATLQWVFYGIGAAVLAGGAALYYLGLDHDESVALLPSVSPQGMGALLRVRL